MNRRSPLRILLFLCIQISLLDDATAQIISGRVLFEQNPVRRLVLVSNRGRSIVRTDTEGRYAVRVDAPGTYRVTPYSTSSRLAVYPIARTVEVNGSDISGVDFTLTRLTETGIVSGFVASDSELLPNVPVRLAGFGTKLTDENGLFTFTKVPAGRYTVSTTSTSSTFRPGLSTFRLSQGRARRLKFHALTNPPGSAYLTHLSGEYQLAVSSLSTDCPVNQSQFDGLLSISQTLNRARVRIQSLGSIITEVTSTGFEGPVRLRRGLCNVAGNLAVTFPQLDLGNASGSFAVECLFATPCALAFSGSLVRR